MSGLVEILVIFLLVITHGVFVLSEIAVVKASRSRLQDRADTGDRRARRALEIVNAPQKVLSVLQAGITLLGILTGAFAATTIAARLTGYVGAFPWLEGYSQIIALAVAVAATGYLMLVVGKLVPERLARTDADKIATIVAVPIHVLSAAFSPVRFLLNVPAQGILRLFGRGAGAEPSVTEEEIKTLVQQATDAGVVEESEQEMVEAVFRLGDKSARALMTPRTQIAWLDLSDSSEVVGQKIRDSGHSRFPVSSGSLDQVIGVVQAKDLLGSALTGQPIDLRACLRQPAFVPRTTPGLQVLDLVKRSGSHIALVVDEYGGIEGLLTHHDILEAIAGEIPFGESPLEPKAVQRHDGSWLLDGMLSVEEFKEIFHLASLPGEKRDAYQTLGGFLFTQMGRVPSVADRFEWSDLRFEVVDMDGKRIDKVLVTLAAQAAPADRTGQDAPDIPKR